jgi:hypothetical protein
VTVPKSSIVVRPAAPGSAAYTAASRLQAAGLDSAARLFAEMAESVPLPKPPHPVVLADYGAATGHNSLLPIGAAIEVLSTRIRKDQAILVTHTDVAENDFTALFHTLADDPDSYQHRYPAAFPNAIGRSVYSQIMPSDSVTLGWSSWAIQLLHHTPGPLRTIRDAIFNNTPPAAEGDRGTGAEGDHRADRRNRSGGVALPLDRGSLGR